MMTPEKRLEVIQRIVKNHQHEKLEGSILDGFTASAIMQVYNALSPENQQKLMSFPIQKMVTIVWGTIKKAQAAQGGAVKEAQAVWEPGEKDRKHAEAALDQATKEYFAAKAKMQESEQKMRKWEGVLKDLGFQMRRER